MSGLVAPPVWHPSTTGPSGTRFAHVVKSATMRTAGTYDAVLVGEPYAMGSKAPATTTTVFREALAGLPTDVGDREFAASVGDLGDVGISHDGTDLSTVRADVARFTGRVYARDAVPVFFGSDSALTVPNARPLLETGSVGMVSVGPSRTGPEPPVGPPPHAALLRAGLEAVSVLGPRERQSQAGAAEDPRVVLDRYDAEHVVPADAVDRDPGAAMSQAISALGPVDAIFASLDLAVVLGANGTGADAGMGSIDGGLIEEARVGQMLEQLAATGRVAGFEVVSSAASMAGNGKGVRVGAAAIARFFAGLGGD